MTEPNPNVPPPADNTGGGAVPPPTPMAPNTPVGYATPGATGYPGPYMGPAPTQDDKTMALLAHLLGILTWFLGPLIIWLIKKDQSPFVDDQGKEALNFQITLTIGYFIGAATICIAIGALIIMAVAVVGLVFGILAAVAANKGEAYRYPFNIRLVK